MSLSAPIVGATAGRRAGVRLKTIRAPSTTDLPWVGWASSTKWLRCWSCGSAKQAAESCTACAGTPTAIRADIASSFERDAVQSSSDSPLSTESSAARSESSRQAIATQRSSPSHGKTPCGDMSGSLLPSASHFSPVSRYWRKAGVRKWMAASICETSMY